MEPFNFLISVVLVMISHNLDESNLQSSPSWYALSKVASCDQGNAESRVNNVNRRGEMVSSKDNASKDINGLRP